MPEIREGALDVTVIDGKPIDPIYLGTTSNKLFEPIGTFRSDIRIGIPYWIQGVQAETELDEQYRQKTDIFLREQQ